MRWSQSGEAFHLFWFESFLNLSRRIQYRDEFEHMSDLKDVRTAAINQSLVEAEDKRAGKVTERDSEIMSA